MRTTKKHCMAQTLGITLPFAPSHSSLSTSHNIMNPEMPRINIVSSLNNCTYLEEEESTTSVGIRRHTFLALGWSICRSSSIDFLPFRVLYGYQVLVGWQQLDVRHSCLGVYLLNLAPPAQAATTRIRT